MDSNHRPHGCEPSGLKPLPRTSRIPVFASRVDSSRWVAVWTTVGFLTPLWITFSTGIWFRVMHIIEIKGIRQMAFGLLIRRFRVRVAAGAPSFKQNPPYKHPIFTFFEPTYWEGLDFLVQIGADWCSLSVKSASPGSFTLIGLCALQFV